MTGTLLAKEDRQSSATVVDIFFLLLLCSGVLLFPFLSRARWNGKHLFEYTLPFWKPSRSNMKSEWGRLISHGGGGTFALVAREQAEKPRQIAFRAVLPHALLVTRRQKMAVALF